MKEQIEAELMQLFGAPCRSFDECTVCRVWEKYHEFMKLVELESTAERI